MVHAVASAEQGLLQEAPSQSPGSALMPLMLMVGGVGQGAA